MKNEKTMPLVKSIVIQYLIGGLAWFGYGFTLLFDNLPCKIIAALLMLIALTCSLITIFCKKESQDEMSNVHMIKAKAASCNFIHEIALVLGIIVPITIIFNVNILIPLKFLFPIILGIIRIIIGIMFVYYEKVGD